MSRSFRIGYGQTTYTYDAEDYRVGTTTADGTVTDVVFDDLTHEPVAHYINHDSTGQDQDFWFNGVNPTIVSPAAK